MDGASHASLTANHLPLPRNLPQLVHIGRKFVDFRTVTDSKFVDKRLAAPPTRPVLFDLPEGAVGTVRRGEERSPQRRRSDRDRTSVRARSAADPELAG